MSDFAIRDESLPLYRRPTHGDSTIPADLHNQSQWRQLGFKLKPDAVPVAQALVGMLCASRQLVNLYSKEQVVPIRRLDKLARDSRAFSRKHRRS